jgi:hypothetical protein
VILPVLYHWSPRPRRKQILRYGLRPLQRSTCTFSEDDEFRQPMVCTTTSAAEAWSLSAGIFGKPGQTWDLWEVYVAQADEVHIQPYWGNRIIEVRVANRIPKSRLWWVGDRTIG